MLAVVVSFWVGGPSSPSPPWRPHALSARDHLGGLCSSWLISWMPRAGRARCRVPSPDPVSLWAWSAVSLVASCLSPLSWSPTESVSSANPAGASKLYSRRVSAPCSGLALSVPAVCLSRVPAMLLSDAAPLCGCGGGAVPGPSILSLSLPPSPRASVARVVGGFLSPPRPCPSSSGTPSPSVITPGAPPGATLPLRGFQCLAATRIHLLLPGGTPVGFPPLRRPHAPPPCPPLPRTRGPLGRPRGPPRRPPLLRTRRPGFPAGQRSSPLAMSSHHGAPPLPPRWWLRRWPSRCHPRWLPRLLIALLCRCSAPPLTSLSASRCTTPPPPRLSPPLRC